jgi:hypothetical protein
MFHVPFESIENSRQIREDSTRRFNSGQICAILISEGGTQPKNHPAVSQCTEWASYQ